MGVKVKIMQPYDPAGKNGVSILLPDIVEFKEIKTAPEEENRAPA
jgi:hypothetical protein